MGLFLDSTQFFFGQDGIEKAGQQARSSLERLSSGVRINDAFDDAASLAIADSLARDTRVAAQAIRNANDGLSAVRIGDQALGQVGQLLGRLSALATQAASGTVNDGQRSAIQAEFGQLVAEVDRIAGSTSFNGTPLLSAGAAVQIQVGLDAATTSQLTFPAVDGTAEGLGVAGLAVSSQAAAQAALGALGSAVAALGLERARLGAVEGHLLASLSNLQVAREQLAAAESRLRDADAAAESATFVSSTIRGNLSVAVAAQANLQATAVLRLLR